MVIAHASSTELGPANTIEMMKAALEVGADVIDADMRITSDGILVAAHDDALVASDGTSVSIETSTLAEIQRFDAAASWAGPKGDYPLRATGVTVPTIEAILTTFPERLTSLEFKVPGAEQTLCDMLRRLKRTKSVYVGSAGDEAVDTFSPLCPEVVTTVTDAMVSVMRAARESGQTWCSPSPIGQPPYSEDRLTVESVTWNHEHGMATFTWTIDDEATLRKLADIGVDAVYTGRADIARNVFDEPSA